MNREIVEKAVELIQQIDNMKWRIKTNFTHSSVKEQIEALNAAAWQAEIDKLEAELSAL